MVHNVTQDGGCMMSAEQWTEAQRARSDMAEFRMLLGTNEGESTVDALHRYTAAVQLGCALKLEQRAKEIAKASTSPLIDKVSQVTVAALIGGATLLRQGVPAASNSPGILDGSDKACAHANRWHAPIGATGFICTDCNERVPDALVARLGASRVTRYPCSDTCTHDDAAKPGHPERLKARSEEFIRSVGTYSPLGASAWEQGAEAMRAACWEAVQAELQKMGVFDAGIRGNIKAAIEGAAP